MKASNLREQCKKLSPTELVAHLQSLAPLTSVPQANKSSEKDGHNKFKSTVVGQKVLVLLSGLYTESERRPMSQQTVKLIDETSFDAIIVAKSDENLTMKLDGFYIQLQFTPYHFRRFVHTKLDLVRPNHMSEAA